METNKPNTRDRKWRLINPRQKRYKMESNKPKTKEI